MRAQTIRCGSVAASVVALLVLAACGGTNDAPTAGSAPTKERATSASPTTPSTTPSPTSAPTVVPTVAAPEALRFTSTTLDGQAYDGARLAGKPAALWFWAPWCHICRDEAPTVKDLAAKYEGAVTIVGVAGLGEPKAMREFVDDTDVDAIAHLADDKGAVWKRFEVTSQASWVLLDAKGDEVFRGRMDHDELADRIAELAS